MIAKRLGAFVPARAGARGLGGGRRRLPRLRLPAAAAPGQDQVPDRRLGRGEVPRGHGEGVPRLRARRRARPGERGRRAARPRRRAPADRTACYYVGFAPRVGRVDGELLAAIATLAEPLRQRPGADHRRAEDGHHSTCRARSVDDAGRRARRARPAGEAERLPAAHDGLHRDRVLQARDRGDQGPGDDADRRARAAAARLRRRRSPSTSTAARTPAPASRSPTSA